MAAILGIGVGVAALIVALALGNGFRDEMREKILRGTAHVSVMRADGRTMPDYREIEARLSRIPGVSNVTGTSYDGALVIGPRASAYAVLRGVDAQSSQTFSELQTSLVEGSSEGIFNPGSSKPAVVVGIELATRTGLRVGETAEIISPNPNSVTIQNPSIGPVKQVKVAGIFRSGLFEYDSTWIYLPLDLVSQFSGMDTSASVISVQLANMDEAKTAAANIRAVLGNSYTTIDWEEANRPLFNALALERRMGAVIVALIIFIAALNIATTLILVVVERRRDIGILSAMGASGRSLMGIFVIEGALIGVLGAILGVALGIIACFIGNRYQLVSLPADVYSITNVPFHAQPREVLLAALVAFTLSLLATIYPARSAARLRPVEILRDAN